MKTKFFLIFFYGFLFAACDYREHKLAFNTQKQILYSCDSSSIRNLSIKNESITKDGFPVEGGILITWEGKEGDKIVKEISISEIPKTYKITKGGIKINKSEYRLSSNSVYLIEKSGGGKPSFYIRIWTDSLGKVFKTTHPKCGLQSLDNGEEMYQKG